MSIADIYNFLYKLSGEVNLFVPISIIIGFTIVLIVIIRLRKIINPLKKAKALRAKGNNVRALVYVDFFLEKYPLSKEGLLLKADIETDLGLYPQAEGDYFRVLYSKTKGDGIDSFEIKKRLLKTLFEQDKIYQTFELAREILSRERTSAEALFYLSLIYMGQLYFREADKILKRLTLNRPKMAEAFYLQAVNFVQLRMFTDAMASINRAIELDEEKKIYHLVKAAIGYFDENYSLADEELKKLSDKRENYETVKRYLFYLKLNAMVNYRLRYYDRATLIFRIAVDLVSKEKSSYREGEGRVYSGKNIAQEKKGFVYGENGKLKSEKQGVFQKGSMLSSVNFQDSLNRVDPENPNLNPDLNPVEDYERRMGLRKNISPEIEEYLRLKEVAIEEGKTELIAKRNIHDPFQLLDIDGLTDRTWLYMSYGFALAKGSQYKQSRDFFVKMRKDHPEIIGLKRIIDLLNEKIEDSKTAKITLEGIRKRSETLMDKKKKRYELWEYIQEWEKRIVRPYDLMEVSGYSTRKLLNPAILFKKDTKFTLDF